MELTHIFRSLGSHYVSPFHVSGLFTGAGLADDLNSLCLPSVSAWAQPVLHTHPKRSTLSPRRPPPLKRIHYMISQRTRGDVRMTNPSWRRGNLWQVGRLPVISCWAWKDALSPALKIPPRLLSCPLCLSLSEEVPLCGLCPSLGLEGPEEEKSWEEHQEQLEKEMQEARRMVFHLQVSHKTKRDRSNPRTPAPNKPFK